MILKDGDFVKHFKGKTLVEKNIYEIVSVNPKYTGTKEYSSEPVVIYRSIFQPGKSFVREYSDLVQELTDEEKMEYSQENRVNILTEDELMLIKTDEFIEKKLEYIASKYGDACSKDEIISSFKLK